MPVTKSILNSSKEISLSFNEYSRLKAIEEQYHRGYSVVPLFFSTEELSEYAHSSRVKKSLSNALKKYPPLVWK
jgi:hypothetical protein